MYLIRRLSFSLLFVSLISCGGVSTDNISVPEPYTEFYSSADTNKDGFFSLSEINDCSSSARVTVEQKEAGTKLVKNNFTEADFTEADKNSDSKLSTEELVNLLANEDTGYGSSLTKCGEEQDK